MEPKAIFSCQKCDESRPFGHENGRPDYNPVLWCKSCQRPTRHVFVRVKRVEE